MNELVTPHQFQKLLPSLCARETAAGGGKGWTHENPTFGHCAVAALVAQNLFGGELLRTSLLCTPFAESGSHYSNLLPNGTVMDFTEQQFGGWKPVGIPAETRPRNYVMNAADTKGRYVELAWRLIEALYDSNPLMRNDNYARCVKQALASPCQKMGFGALVTPYMHQHNNHAIPGLESICQPDCIRKRIQSRTESMLGACGHAEEWAIWNQVKNGQAPYDLFVAGVHANGLPYIKQVPEHTCLRCAVAITYAAQFGGLKSVWVPVVDRWEPLTPQECLTTARAYALKEKLV